MKARVANGSTTDSNQGLDLSALSHHLFSLSIDLMCIAGLDGYFKQVNPAFERTLGWTAAELTERPFLDFVHPQDQAPTIAEMQKLATGAVTISFENRYRAKDGSYRWLMWNTTPAPEEGLLYAVAHDITRRKQVEEESSQLAAIIASSSDAIIGKTLDGTIVSWNLGAEKLYGYSAHEVIGRSSVVLGPSHDYDYAEIVKKITQGETVDHYETTRVRKDGRQMAVSLTMSPIRDTAGKITGVSTIARDITERKLVEKALHESEKRFELAARATSDVIWDWDVTTDSLWFNDSVGVLFGYQAGQVQNHIDWWSGLVHPDDRGRIRSSLRATLDSGEEFWSGEYRLRRADGSYAYVLDRGFIVHDASGRPVRMIGSMMDVSEHRRLEQTLAASAVKLERSNRDLEEFASIASHDLQEPLRKIQAFGDRLSTIAGSSLDEEGYDCVARMLDAATRMRTLIDELLTYSRLVTKGQPFAQADLTTVASDVLSDLEVQVTRTGGCVEVRPLPVIEADPNQMRRLLQNLISNALKFHRDDEAPFITVRGQVLPCGGKPSAGASEGGQWCQIVVEDNGIGFDEKYADRIFAPFKRLHTRGQYEGTGMGLAACRKIVENHGGSIAAESAPGQGAAFIVTLPTTQAAGANALC